MLEKKIEIKNVSDKQKKKKNKNKN